MSTWVILTPEFPPAPGGVADYTAQVAAALARTGDAVHVWSDARAAELAGVTVHALPRGFDRRARRRLDAALAGLARPIVVVQYVPLGFGRFNPLFFRWLETLRQPVWVMFHEVAFPLSAGQRWRHRALARWTRRTARGLLRHAERVLCSTRVWEPMLRELGWRGPAPVWVPVPSNLPHTAPRSRDEVRREIGVAPEEPLIAHFGTYGPHLTPLIEAVVEQLLARHAHARCLLLGRGADGFAARLSESKRISAVADAAPERIAELIAAADVLFYPFSEGATTRRTSLAAALALGKAVVTTDGPFVDPIWAESRCVELCPRSAGPLVDRVLALLADDAARAALERRALDTYRSVLALEHTVAKLRMR